MGMEEKISIWSNEKKLRKNYLIAVLHLTITLPLTSTMMSNIHTTK
jgi:hypothetical protein